MVSPAGVNEGIPQEPVKAGLAHAAETDPAETDPAGAVPAEADPAGAMPAEADPAGAMPAGAMPAGAVHSPAEPAEEELAAAPEGELAETGHAEAELAGAGGPGWDAEDESRDVSPLAVAGIILGVIALVGVAVGVLAVVTHGFRPKTVVTYRPAAVFGLRPGQCINSGTNALAVTVLSCARPHDAEVFATFSLPATGWPGTSAVRLDASNGCVSRFGSYLSSQLATADLTQEYVYPNEAAWQAGERTVVCEVRAVSGRLTGSVRAKG